MPVQHACHVIDYYCIEALKDGKYFGLRSAAPPFVRTRDFDLEEEQRDGWAYQHYLDHP